MTIFLIGDKDRMRNFNLHVASFLKQLRINREEERDLMKNVEGWEVGTYYGEPIYKTVSDDTLVEPRIREYYIHNSYGDAKKRLEIREWA